MQIMPQKQLMVKNDTREKIVSKNIFESDFYHLKHWSYDLLTDKQTMPGYNDCLCIMYVRKGNYLSDFFAKTHEMYSGYILLEKPDCEYKIKPSAGECTIINFTHDFYRKMLTEMNISPVFFFTNKSLLSVVLKSIPEIDYLHYRIINRLNDAGKLEMDNLVIEFFNLVVQVIANDSLDEEVTALLKVNRLPAVELAKDYMNKNFVNDISLQEVSSNSFISPFHFSRIFKRITSYSPHQYLQNIRLKHSEMLLKNSSMPVSDIAYASGFASTAYFSTAFRQKYKMNPQQYRKLN
jgi:AraC family transcriptional regulator